MRIWIKHTFKTSKDTISFRNRPSDPGIEGRYNVPMALEQ